MQGVDDKNRNPKKVLELGGFLIREPSLAGLIQEPFLYFGESMPWTIGRL